jgi:hypothetical protein
MPSGVLTNEELGKARELLDDIRQRLLTLSNDDKDLLFAYRRKIGKELIYDEPKSSVSKAQAQKESLA